MLETSVYREVKAWKRPLHASRTQLAKSYLKLLSQIEVISITGSVGKTLTQNAIAAVLSQKFRVAVGDENLDPTFRIPQTILKTRPWHQKLILEYGVERPGDIDHYLKIVIPKIAVVTTIAPTHLRYFKNIEGVFKEKVKLIAALPKNGHAILNAEDPYCRRMSKITKARIWWYGRKLKSGVWISHFNQHLKGSTFSLHHGKEKATVSWGIIGEHQLVSANAAATVGLVCGLTLKQIAKGLTGVKSPAHRLNSIATKTFSIIDDSYNASPKSAIEAINTLISIGKGREKIAVFGEMKDLGEFSKRAHEILGDKIARSSIQCLVTIGKIAQIIGKAAKKQGFGGRIVNVTKCNLATEEIRKMLSHKSLVLVKGSRHAHLERIVNGLLHKSTQINCYHCGVLR